MSFQTINPATNKVVKSFEEMTDVAVDNAVAKSVAAFEEWKKTDYHTRGCNSKIPIKFVN